MAKKKTKQHSIDKWLEDYEESWVSKMVNKLECKCKSRLGVIVTESSEYCNGCGGLMRQLDEDKLDFM